MLYPVTYCLLVQLLISDIRLLKTNPNMTQLQGSNCINICINGETAPMQELVSRNIIWRRTAMALVAARLRASRNVAPVPANSSTPEGGTGTRMPGIFEMPEMVSLRVVCCPRGCGPLFAAPSFPPNALSTFSTFTSPPRDLHQRQRSTYGSDGANTGRGPRPPAGPNDCEPYSDAPAPPRPKLPPRGAKRGAPLSPTRPPGPPRLPAPKGIMPGCCICCMLLAARVEYWLSSICTYAGLFSFVACSAWKATFLRACCWFTPVAV